jgi:hypothetical protein
MKIIEILAINQEPISAKVNQESNVNIVNIVIIVKIMLMNTVRKDLRVNKGKTKTEASWTQFRCLMVLIVLLLKAAHH